MLNSFKCREGVFAGERIHANTFIGIYAGEFVTDEEGERRGKSAESGTFICESVLIQARVYNLAGKTYLFDIDFWHINEKAKKSTGNTMTKFCVDAFHVGNVRISQCDDRATVDDASIICSSSPASL